MRELRIVLWFLLLQVIFWVCLYVAAVTMNVGAVIMVATLVAVQWAFLYMNNLKGWK